MSNVYEQYDRRIANIQELCAAGDITEQERDELLADLKTEIEIDEMASDVILKANVLKAIDAVMKIV